MTSSPNTHVVVFPFMSHSHTFPLIDLSIALSRHQARVTIVTVPANSSFISPRIQTIPLISLADLHFPAIDGLPEACRCQNLSEIPSLQFFVSFLTATTPFNSSSNPWRIPATSLCASSLITFLVGTPAFAKTSAFQDWSSMPPALCHFSSPKPLWPMLITRLLLPLSLLLSTGFCRISAADVLDVNLSSNTDSNPFAKFIAEAGEAELQSWGVIANSFVELEIDFISPLESFYSKGAKIWCVGPTFLYGRESTTNHHKDDNSVSLMKWLDGRAAEAS
ncbi:UDP-glycosyltransferase 73B4-like [Cucurbita moschata]|uniref:UDP-glycosyltransferase 73B4-like n=1 Tax=Cucurbita moschata TaxID=3662 RepID=A0A6J1FRF5_CUCMO|nr:UDP-glycosyltransferase 73B4-like [Cucurbita moschata]